jgi:hypothetical protein
MDSWCSILLLNRIHRAIFEDILSWCAISVPSATSEEKEMDFTQSYATRYDETTRTSTLDFYCKFTIVQSRPCSPRAIHCCVSNCIASMHRECIALSRYTRKIEGLLGVFQSKQLFCFILFLYPLKVCRDVINMKPWNVGNPKKEKYHEKKARKDFQQK